MHWLAGILQVLRMEAGPAAESERTRGLCALGLRRLPPLWSLGENDFYPW